LDEAGFEKEGNKAIATTMVSLGICETPTDDEFDTVIECLRVNEKQSRQDISGVLAEVLGMVLTAEDKNDFRSWRR
jgi:hypothetical protein